MLDPTLPLVPTPHASKFNRRLPLDRANPAKLPSLDWLFDYPKRPASLFAQSLPHRHDSASSLSSPRCNSSIFHHILSHFTTIDRPRDSPFFPMALVLTPPTLPHISQELVPFSRQIFGQVEAFLQSDGTEASNSAQNVLGSFYEQVEALAANADEADDIEGPLGVFWITILETSAQLPHDHPARHHLTKLLSAIKTQPAPAEPTLSAAAVGLLQEFEQDWSQPFWQALPGFGMMVHNTQSLNPAHAEEYIELNGHRVPANLGVVPYSPDQWNNLQGFLRLCKTEGVMDLLLDEES